MRKPGIRAVLPRYAALAASALCVSMAPVRADAVRVGSIHHYVFFNMDRQRIHDASFLQTKSIEGAQLKYTWRQLEPKPNVYHFKIVRDDLAFLRAHGKRLFIQLQDVTFEPKSINVPPYLLSDPKYHGGANPQYDIPGDNETNAPIEGWVARRWDPAVRERFARLLSALGQEFDGKIEGINLAETAVNFGESGKLYPKGFTPPLYRDAILANMTALKRAFPKSVTMQYANFMPGEWLPWTDKGYLKSVYQKARALKVGVGGPDLMPYKKGQMAHAYPLIRASYGIIPTGIAVQDGNSGYKNPKNGKVVTLPDLVDFATHYLKVKYIFWGTEDPFYSRKLIPYLKGQKSVRSNN
jgi:hypothetical protein